VNDAEQDRRRKRPAAPAARDMWADIRTGSPPLAWTVYPPMPSVAARDLIMSGERRSNLPATGVPG
jgi:hypothetical protein